MKSFLQRSALFLVMLFISFFFIFLLADGYTDPFYIRFTTKKQSSLVLGNSRAAQGIQPAVLNRVLSRNDLFNYSFTIGHSPFGPTYLESIKRKLDTSTHNGIFIVTVDPWAISNKSKEPNDPEQFREKRLMLGKTTFVNLKPNIQYLLISYGEPFYTILPLHSKHTFLHNDEWLEIDIKMDSASVKKRIKNKIEDYRNNNLTSYNFSLLRYKYLVKTIDFLKNYGKVYLVRLPVHPGIMEIDEELVPDFNEKMLALADSAKIPYLDLSNLNSQFLYTDGNHLYKKSGEMVSEKIGNWILNNGQ